MFSRSILIGAAVCFVVTSVSAQGPAKVGPLAKAEDKKVDAKKAVVDSAPAPARRPGEACTDANGLTLEEISQLLDGHNKERASLNVPAIEWDCTLAHTAQQWATRGVAEHQPFDNIGENIFVSSDPASAVTAAVSRWMGEKPNFNLDQQQCTPAKICMHYTQLIDKASLRLGCGVNRNATGKWKLMLVCDYEPKGNMNY